MIKLAALNVLTHCKRYAMSNDTIRIRLRQPDEISPFNIEITGRAAKTSPDDRHSGL